MSGIKALEKLRELCVGVKSEGFASVGCDAVLEIADEIERDYIELPVDADGVPIRMGDSVEGELLDDSTVSGTVCAFHLYDDEPDSVYIKVNVQGGWTIKDLRLTRCRHAKPRTIEDVLRDVWKEALDYANSAMWRNPDEVFAERADEIRELMDGGRES